MPSKRITAVVVIVVVLASPAGAGFGIQRDTLRDYQSTLSGRGWKVRSGRPLMEWPGRAGSEQPAGEIDQQALERSVNPLIDAVLETFSKEDAGKVTAETKRDIVRVATEAIAEGVKDSKTTLRTGVKGSLCYRVGVFRFRVYSSPAPGLTSAQRKEWERWEKKDEHSGLAPLVALMPRPARPAETRLYLSTCPPTRKCFSTANARRRRETPGATPRRPWRSARRIPTRFSSAGGRTANRSSNPAPCR